MLRPRRALRLPALHLPAPRLPAGGEAILQGLHLSVAPGVAAGQCAAAIAVLAATMVHRTGWVLVPGSLRYVFGGLRQVAPALRGGLQPRLSRRVAAGASMVALVITTWPQVPGRAVHVLSAGATMALLASFTRDSVDLLHAHAASPPGPATSGRR